MKNIPGHISEREYDFLFKEAGKVPENGIILELGSYLGRSTYALASGSAGSVQVYAVDTWDNRNMGNESARDTFGEFLKNTANYEDKIITIREDTFDASMEWIKNEKIDLLFIDADHKYESVLADLFNWVPKIGDGGKLFLHDYTEKCGVKPAWEYYFKVKKDIGYLIEETEIVSSIFVVRFV